MAPGRRTVVTTVLAVAGGLLGTVADVPAGALLGSMLFVGAYNILSDGKAELLPPVRTGARVLTGTAIGSLVTASVLSFLGTALPWILGATVLVIGVGLACGWLFARLTGTDRATALLAFSPGGMTEMSAVAEERGARAEVVAAVHMVLRLLVLASVIAAIALLGLA